MRLTTKGRYGMRLVLDIAQHEGGGPVSINEISQRQGVSAKYLERLVGDLRRAGFVRSQRGRDGGHVLAMSPESITVGAIVRALEGESFLLACCKNRHTCPRSGACLTRAIWIAADQAMYEKLNSVSVRNILDDARKCVANRDGVSASFFTGGGAAPQQRANLRSRDAGSVCPAPQFSGLGPDPMAEAEATAPPTRVAPARPLAAAPAPRETVAATTAPPLAALSAASASPLAASTQQTPGQTPGLTPGQTRVRRMARRVLLRRQAALHASAEAESEAELHAAGDPAQATPATMPTPRHRTVLVVAQEELLARMQAVLGQAGYEVLGATDGPSALALFAEQRPDLLAVDLFLPGSWGPRLCGELARQEGGSPPVLVLSGVPDMHLALRGAVATLPRDADAQALLAVVSLTLAQNVTPDPDLEAP